jgi:YARHG domain
MKQMSSSLAGPLILPVPAQIERESPMATAQISPPSSRKLTLIAVAIAVLMIVGGAGWYLGHKREVAPEKLSGSSTQVERQIPIVNPTEDEAASKQPEPIATQPQRTAAKDLTVLPTEDVARAQQPQQEVGAKEGFHVSNSPTIAQPSIAPARGPWLFPDSSSRYLSANDLSSLSSADLWRARNEIFARKGYKFSRPRGIAFAQTLGNYYRGVDDDQDRVFNNMNQYERANVTLIRAIEKGR